MCNALEIRGVSLLECTNKADVVNETACSGKDAGGGGGGGARAGRSQSRSHSLVLASEEVAVRVPQNSSYLRFGAPLVLGRGGGGFPFPNSVVPGVLRTQLMPLYNLGFPPLPSSLHHTPTSKQTTGTTGGKL